MFGGSQLIQPLVEAGADLTARDRSGQTPLDIALDYKSGPAVAALLKLGIKLKESQAAAEHAMESATFRGQTEIVRLLVDNGFDVNSPTPSGSAYLNDAAIKGQMKVAEFLLNHGAEVAKPDGNGNMPIHDAAVGGNSDVIVLLLDHGADINARNRESLATPLMLAASLGRADAVALLLKRGANPVLRDKAGHTALNRALQTDSKETIRLLQAAPLGKK
jgi:ankyrin repeat protein